MNFSKNEIAKKQRSIRSSSTRMKKKAQINGFRLFLVCVLIVISVGIASGYGVIKGLIDTAPNIDSIDVVPTGYATFIYDNEGKVTQRLVGSSANRIYVKIDKIPDVVKNAFISIEDERFYEHNGIDIRGIMRAFFTGVSSGGFSQGASTLTQQLLKNQVFEGGNEASFITSMQRKIQEQYLAVQLEEKLTKDQILEYYLNTINLGANTLGVQAASQRYFNKKVEDLTLSEAAVIAGITQSPTSLNPITNPDNNAKRRTEVLKKMLDLNYITQHQYDEAISDNVYDRINEVNNDSTKSYGYNSYFVDELIEQVSADLQEKLGYSSTQANNLIYTGGLKIHTTQDSALQETVDSVIDDPSYYPKDTVYELEWRFSVLHSDGTETHYSESNLKSYFLTKDEKNNIPSSQKFTLYFKNKDEAKPYIKEYKKHVLKDGDKVEAETTNFKLQPQVSFTLMDQHTGQVKALVGGRGDKNGNRTLNRASNTVRQPGSTFKVLSTYLPALDTAGMTLATVQDDSEYYYPGTSKKVGNWDGSKYKGLSTLRDAITNSMNVVTVKTLNEITPQLGFDYLKKLGFTTLVDRRVNKNGSVDSDLNLSLGLGGVTDGVTNLELTAAYSAIANGGVYTKPVFYTKIEDRDGNLLLENKAKSTQVMKESTAWLLTNAMEDVVKTGTGKMVRLSGTRIPVAGKTGTTSKYIDLWFAGYTPYYTATIWGGYDYGETQRNTTYHKLIWKAIMEKIHKNLPVKDFEKPSSIVSAKICTKSGKLAVDGICNEAEGGSTVRTEYFAQGTEPTEKCDVHVKLKICKSSNKLATKYCPEDDVEERVYLLKDETGKTADTPYILPKGLDKTSCNVHSENSILDISPDETETPKPSNKPNNGDSQEPTPTPDPNSAPVANPNAGAVDAITPDPNVTVTDPPQPGQ
ncbi:multimodular transpeptidase-transglycosylase [Lachnospiraceae bacterium KM106-2]|nr:multimodular transpeptidase-transglycosylase [Lachnospiraceae bacterium KM106-2]